MSIPNNWLLGKSRLTLPNTSVSTRPWVVGYGVYPLHSSIHACGSLAPPLNVLIVVITVIRLRMWFSSSVWIFMHPYIYIAIEQILSLFTTVIEFVPFSPQVTFVKLLLLKASQRIEVSVSAAFKQKNLMRNWNLLSLAEVCQEIFFPQNFEDWL